MIQYPASIGGADRVLEAAIDAGAQDVESGDHGHFIATAPDDLNQVREALEKSFGAPVMAKLSFKPLNTLPIAGEVGKALLKLIDTLEDNDDVQTVFGNYELDAALLAEWENG
jgi:transcriptional/translational regulatory protein YebC/TACO1